MESLPIRNPFTGAVSFLVRETSSTQDEAKRLSKLGFPAGSVVAAEFQSSGRGRFPERRWDAEVGKNLLFTLKLDPSQAMTPALPLRVGAALCRAASIQAIKMGIGFHEDHARVKWPNDLLLGGRKAAGILCEAGPEGVFVGIGVNCNQSAFPDSFGIGATSLAGELGAEVDRWAFLELLLGEIQSELAEPEWRPGVEKLIWRLGKRVRFLPGLPGSGEPVEGRLEGIDSSGSILIGVSDELAPLAFAAGELILPRRDRP